MSTKVLPSNEAESLEADGLGGFASGTVSGVRTRRYHGLLVPATTPLAVRTVVVNGFEAWAEVSGGCNALWIGSHFSRRWKELFEKAKASFGDRFWNESASGLFDVLDCDHRPGFNDPSLRPNQIFAVGGLPLSLLEGERARRVVGTVEANLLTPIGLRSLGPKEPAYVPRYEGGVAQRDGCYHRGTVWPWLIGPLSRLGSA